MLFLGSALVDCIWNVMAHAQKPDFVFRRNGRVHLNRRGRQFSRLLADDLCTSACRVCTARASLRSAVMWRLLVTHAILLFPLHFSSRASPCAITFQLDSTDSLYVNLVGYNFKIHIIAVFPFFNLFIYKAFHRKYVVVFTISVPNSHFYL
jgi:hypothetical protein